MSQNEPTAVEPISIETSCVEPSLTGCINRNFCSSFLFFLPAIYGYSIDYYPVMVGSILCLLTSTSHHYYQSQHILLQKIDRIVVNSVAAYFIYDCITSIGYSFYANIMYVLVIATLICFFYITFNPNLYQKYYLLVHILAITGILFYIKAYSSQITGD